jgi:F-type H+-transporting ATPase subunit epsilon
MANSFKFDLVSPERLLVSEDVISVVVPGAEGEMTVMADHSPVMTTVNPGVVTVQTVSGETQRFVVFGGFADIVGDACTLLAESAVDMKSIDRADIQHRIEAAKSDLDGISDDGERTRLETFLAQLTTLEGKLLPA